MDGALSATWVISIACTTLAVVATAVFVAVGAYKIGKVTGQLKKAQGKAGDLPSVAGGAPGAPPVDAPGEDEAATSDAESDDNSSDADDSADEEDSDEEVGRRSRKMGEGGGPNGKKAGKGKSKGKSKSKAKKVKDDDWEWPVYDQWWSQSTETMERKRRVTEKKGKPNKSPFEVTYEQQKGWPDIVTVKLWSKPLIHIAKKCLSKHSEMFIVEEVEINGREMFVTLNSFRETYDTIKENDISLARCHLKHLLRFLETEYKNTIVRTERMKREKKITWPLLWAFLHKGERVYYTCQKTGQTLQGIVKFVYYQPTMQGKTFICRLRCYDWNGLKYVKCETTVTIDEFKDEKSFEAIGICPMAFLDESETAQMEAMFLRNGRKFYNIVSKGSYYMEYEGPRLRMTQVNDCWQLKKQKADGRVMADLLSFARMNPGYPLENAEPPTCCGSRGFVCGNDEMPSDENLMMAPAVVYGFSFSNKLWGGFDVNGFSEVHFDDRAFDRDLVLTDPTRKKMLLALVSQHLKSPSDEGLPKLDPISNKGDGCIFLCYGPPGTGKTLTAESMAEKLHRPLWSISVFELGTTAKDLEMNLIEILDIASQWRAVLLLDEADIYMEKRTSNGDVSRTAMTAIFLRLLEYYRGVLFLTTNRVASFDDAFCSRISMFLRYHRLEGKQREAVWGNLFARAGVANPDLAPFMKTRLNGREIRNTIRIAQTWAQSSEMELTTDHVLQVMNMLGEFRQDLEGAIQDESDERSISRALAKVRSMKASDNAGPLNGHFVQIAPANDDEETF